jgi:hypothetical protein
MRPRRLLAVVVSAALGAAVIAGGAMAAGGHSASRASSASTPLPVKAMERALHAKGTVTGENLNFGIDRTDITGVTSARCRSSLPSRSTASSISSLLERTARS